MPTTSSLPSSGRWGARSATSSPFRSAGCIIASCIGAATNAPGGRTQGIDPLPIAATLWERTHAARIQPTAELAGDMRSSRTKLNGSILATEPAPPIQHQNDETKPIVGPEAG